MQQSGNAALATAVDASVRTIVYKVEADWDRDGSWDHALSDLTSVTASCQVERDIVNVLPPETTVIEGYYSAKLTLRLGGFRPGDASTIAALLSPWRADSPLYGDGRMAVPVRAWIGHRDASGAQILVQQFMGEISESRFSSSGREVTLVCLDGSEKMQNSIDLPIFALAPNSVRDFGLNLMLRTNSQWVIDNIFRQCGFYMTPPPQTGAFYVATLHGGPAPEMGHQTWFWTGAGLANEHSSVYWPGRSGWGLGYGGSREWWGVIQSRGYSTLFTPSANKGICIQAQVDLSKAASCYPGQGGNLVMYCSGNGYCVGTSILLKVSATGQLIVDFYSGTSLVQTINGPTLGTAGWTDCWVEIDFGSSLSNSTVRFPGLTLTGQNLSMLPASPILSSYSHVFTFAQVPMHDLQLTNRTGLATGATRYNAATWVPQVDLDTGLNDLTGIPLRRGVVAWDLLKEVVGAEYGVVGFSETGRPFFKNRNTVRRSSLTTVKTFNQDKVLTDFGMSERTGSVRNVVTSHVAPRLMAGPLDTWESWSVVWELKDPEDMVVVSGQSVFEVTLDEPGARVDAYVEPIHQTTAQWNDTSNTVNSKHGYVASNAATGADVAGGVDVIVLPLTPTNGRDRIRIYITNTSGVPLKFRTTDGNPAFRIRGNAYLFGTTEDLTFTRSSSVVRYGQKVLEIAQSEWHQLPFSLQEVSTSLLRDLKTPVPVIDTVTAVGDCRLQLTDTGLVEDRGGLGGPMNAMVIGCRRSLEIQGGGGEAKLVDSLNMRPISAPGKWILGHTTWSKLGQTTKL